MKFNPFLKTGLIILFFASIFIGCSSDDNASEPVVRINGTALVENDDDFFGDINGDFTGTGGSITRSFTWQNNLSTAEYNADITTTASGAFRMVVTSANGATVLNKTLNGSIEPDSFSGVTTEGTPGVWTVTITLTNFNGDGSFSLSEGT